MNKPNQAVTIFFCLSIFCAALSAGQPTQTEQDQTKGLFNEGVAYFNAEKYWDAQNIFQTISARAKSGNPLVTSSAMMLIKTAYRLGEADRSETLAREFLQAYPNSRYASEVKVTLAEILLAEGKYREALTFYLDLLMNYSDQNLLELCADHAETILDFYLDLEEVKALRDFTTDAFTRQYLTMKLAEKYHAEGDTKQALKELRQMTGQIENKYLREQYQLSDARLKRAPLPRKYIGVILPLTGANSSVGQKVLNGVKYAIAGYRKTYHADIAALVFDNRGESVQNIRHAEFLARNPKVLAIFGPISTEDATLVAVVANQMHIPMITPTASGSQLASLGPYIFQGNVDYENLGRFLSLYSAKISGVKTVASIASADEFGREFTDAYCRTIDEYGGQVVSQQWYQGEPVELKLQISNVHDAAADRLKNHFSEKYNSAKRQLNEMVKNDPRFNNDSLRIAVGDQQCVIFKRDTTYRLSLRETLIMTGLMKNTDFEVPRRDTLAFPPGLVDGFLLPARANDASLIVPQLIYYDIRGNLFGSANWNDPDLLKKNRDVLHGLRFVSDYFIDTESKNFRQVATDFAKQFGAEPGRLELYGYDTMNALLAVINRGAVTREQIREGLIEMPVYRGLCRNISFKGNRPRVNSCAFILGYDRDKIRPAALIENGNIIIGDKVIR